jgi:hypothetical protein
MLNQLRNYYKNTAVALLNFLVLGLFIFGLFHLSFYVVKHFLFPILPQQGYPDKLLQKAYPNLSAASIQSFISEWRTGQWGVDGKKHVSYQPYSYFKTTDRDSQHINVAHGFREGPGQGPWPIDPSNFNIFLFGGSTAFGYYVKDNETIAAYLQQIFLNSNKNLNVKIYNFGQAGYYSTQERILFERLLSHGNIPHAAIFLDGLNDFYHRDDVPFGHDHVFKDMYEKSFAKRLLEKLNFYYNPLEKIRAYLENYRKYKQNSSWKSYYWDNPKAREKKFNDGPILEKVLRTYLSNVSLLDSAGQSFGVKVGFFWQPIPHYNGSTRHFPFYSRLNERHLYSEFGYKLFRGKIDSGQVRLPRRFGWLADIQKETEGFLYVDAAHYTAVFSKVIAQYIYEDLVSWALLPSKV